MTQVQKAATRVVDDTNKELRSLNQARAPAAPPLRLALFLNQGLGAPVSRRAGAGAARRAG